MRITRSITGPILIALLALIASFVASPAMASTHTASEVAAAVMQSPLNSDMKRYASNIGNLAMFESGGRTTIYNGSCCTGILQMSQSNIRNYGNGMTRQEYAQLPLQQQVDMWARLTNDASRASSVKTLMSMAENGQSFDGRPVDFNLIMACIQLGTGNCQQMVRSGSCSGFADSNGTTICDMANRMGDPQNISDPYENAEGDPNQPSSTGSRPDLSPQECWACDATSYALQLVDPMVQTAESIVDTHVIGLVAVIFMIAVAIHISKGFFYIPSLRFAPLWWMTLRLAVVMTLLTAGTLYSEVMTPYVIKPALQAGGYLGTEAARISVKAIGSPAPGGTCTYREIPNATPTAAAARPVIDVVCAVSLAFNKAIEQVSIPANRIRAEDNSIKGWIISGLLSICGLISMGALWMGLLAFAGQIIDAIIRIAVFAAAAPYAAIMWIFQTGRRTLISNLLHGYLYAVILLAVAGLLTGVMLMIVSVGMKAAFASSVVAVDSGSMLMEAILLFIYAIVTGTMTAKIMQSAPPIAALFATHGIMSVAQQLSGAIASGVTTGISAATSLAGFGAGTLAAGTGAGIRFARDIRIKH